MEFKQLQAQPAKDRIRTFLFSTHLRRTVLSMLTGAVAGFVFFYLTEGRHINGMIFSDYIYSILIGAFLGFYLTNSPCARNRC